MLLLLLFGVFVFSVLVAVLGFGLGLGFGFTLGIRFVFGLGLSFGLGLDFGIDLGLELGLGLVPDTPKIRFMVLELFCILDRPWQV